MFTVKLVAGHDNSTANIMSQGQNSFVEDMHQLRQGKISARTMEGLMKLDSYLRAVGS